MNRYQKLPVSKELATQIWSAILAKAAKIFNSKRKIQEQFEMLSKDILENTGESISNTLLRDTLYYPIKNGESSIKISKRTLKIISSYIDNVQVREKISQMEYSTDSSPIMCLDGIWRCVSWGTVNGQTILIERSLEMRRSEIDTLSVVLNSPFSEPLSGWASLKSNTLSIVFNDSRTLFILVDTGSVSRLNTIRLLTGICLSSHPYGQLSTKVALIKERSPIEPRIYTSLEEVPNPLRSELFVLEKPQFICNISSLDSPPVLGVYAN
jgi:hypothetical protein